MRSVTWVIIEDVHSGEWGIGGQALTTEAVNALAAGEGVAVENGNHVLDPRS